MLKVDSRHLRLSSEMRNTGYHDDQPFYPLESESSQMYERFIFDGVSQELPVFQILRRSDDRRLEYD